MVLAVVPNNVLLGTNLRGSGCLNQGWSQTGVAAQQINVAPSKAQNDGK
jgi:hypothetical protein